jgi:hypothetical protein
MKINFEIVRQAPLFLVYDRQAHGRWPAPAAVAAQGGTMHINDAITQALESVNWKVDRLHDRGDETTMEVSPFSSRHGQTSLRTRQNDVRGTWDTWTEAQKVLGLAKLKASMGDIVRSLFPGSVRTLSPADWTP